MSRTEIWAVLRRREVIVICLFTFLTDTIIGTTSPTLSLYARNLGASLTLIGILATTMGLARLGSSLIIGPISDRRGRKNILLAGMALMGLATLLYSLNSHPFGLIPINLMFGVSFVATLTIGLAYVTDVTSTRERSLVFGLITTAMGLGFAIGSLLGGHIAANWGYPSAYRVALALALVAFGLIWRGLPDPPRPPAPAGLSVRAWWLELGAMLTDPIVVAICVGTMLSNLIFGGLIVTFLPIYANGLGLSQALIGSLFATRALASTLARLPAGVLGTIVPNHLVLLASLVLSTAVAFSLPQSAGSMLLMVLLVVEGVGYGLYLTSGQTAIAQHANESSRGAALGVYMAAASVGDSIAPLFLGMVADRLGIVSVFYVVGSLALLGILSMTWLVMRRAGLARVSQRL